MLPALDGWRRLSLSGLLVACLLMTDLDCSLSLYRTRQFIDAHGMEEAGVDGGGIFKEFLEAVRAVVALCGGGAGAAVVDGRAALGFCSKLQPAVLARLLYLFE